MAAAHSPPTVGKIPPNPPFSKGGDEKPSIEKNKDAASKPPFEKGGLGGFEIRQLTGFNKTAKLNEELHFTANFNGDPATPAAWDGELELRYNGGNLGAFLASALPTNTRLTTTRAHLDSWLRLRAGAIEQVALQLDVLGVNVAATSALTIDRLQTQAQLQRQPDGSWAFTLVDLSASQPSSHGGTGIAGVNIKLLTTAAGAPTQVAITADQLDLADLSALLRASPWPLPAALTPLLAAQPHGRLAEFAIHAQRPAPDLAWQWQTAAALFVVGSARTATQPGFSGIDGRLTANQDGGQLQLDAQHLTLDSAVTAAPLGFDQLSGQLQWQRTAAGSWQFDGRELQFANADLSGSARFALNLPPDGSSPQLELHGQLRNLPAARVTQYLPINKLSPPLVAWLQRALLAGRITSADLDFNGRLADYPFRDRPGHFDLRLAFAELQLGYHADWPPLTAATGTLHLHNQGLKIAVQRGRIYDSDFTAGAVDIPELHALQQVVIHGEIAGPFSDGVRALTTTPLATKLGAVGKLLTVSGRSQLALTVTVPLVKGNHVGVSGKLSWPQPATLTLRDTLVQLTALGGALHFTESGLRSEALTAKLWGQATQLKLATEGTASALRLRINAESKTPLPELAQQVPSPLWVHASGALAWQLAVTVPPAGTTPLALDYRLTSDLRGVALKLPAPLGKLAPAVQKLALDGTLIPKQTLTLNGTVGALATQLKLALEDRGARIIGGQLRLGVAKSPPTPLFQRGENASELLLVGRLKELNLGAWIELFGAQVSAVSAKKPASSQKGGAAVPLALDLRVERLALGTLRFHNVTIKREAMQPAGEITIKANELAGKVRLADGAARPLALTLERLDLQPLLAPAADAKAQQAQKTKAKATLPPPVELPSLELRVADLRWNQTTLGRLELALRRTADEQRLERLTLDNAGVLTASGSGSWQRGAGGGQSAVKLTLKTEQLGTVLRLLDEASAVEAGRARAELQLNWRGGFNAFQWQTAESVIDVDVGAGRLLKVEPGLGRLLGVINFGALSRRLTLDFSDLYGKGFAFERIKGRVSIRDGRAEVSGFTIDGPAGLVQIEGETDLIARQFNQTVTVAPKLGSGIALAGAVAGGPVVGAAVYLVDKVAGNPFDRLTRYRYRVTGSWQEPKFQRVGWESFLNPSVPKVREETNHFLSDH
nr:YhdP family protein [Chromatium okenii]